MVGTMATSVKISISLPDRTLREVEERRAASRETRSDYFRRAVEALLREERERYDLARTVAGYAAQPETEPELAWGALGGSALAASEW
jgi:metal-responsive CopG/Arc/MetJ family transcriptional regulator